MNLKLPAQIQQVLKPLLISILISSGLLLTNAYGIQQEPGAMPSWQEQVKRPQTDQLRSVIEPVKWAKKEQDGLRSKGEVVKQIRKRYNAKILRISLDSRGNMYNVRILMPSGRLRDITVSAYR